MVRLFANLPKRVRWLLAALLLVPCLVTAASAILSRRSELEMIQSFWWVHHTLQVLDSSEALRSLLLAAESNQRGFLLTHQMDYNEIYENALKNIPAATAALSDLIKDNPVQVKNVGEITALFATRLDLLQQARELEMGGDHAGALAIVSGGKGFNAMRAIAAEFAELVGEERRLLGEREQMLTSKTHSHTLYGTLLLVANLLTLAALVVVLWYLRKAQNLVTMCAWSRTIEHNGEWLSFEQYLFRRFGINTSHGISPEELKNALKPAA